MNSPVGNLRLLVPSDQSIALQTRPVERICKPERRAFLFLQGPPGPLLHRLAMEMRGRGAKVRRINICAGDRADWPEPAANFRGRFGDWPVFFDNFLRDHKITDILLFGDCRPYHASARRIAALRGVRTYVLEEGYLRPHWMTLELDGVNGHSRLVRNREWLVEQARALRRSGSCRRSRRTFVGVSVIPRGTTSPFTQDASPIRIYRTHRPGSAIFEALGWGWKYLVRDFRARQADEVLRGVVGKPFFLFPLQLSVDYQIRSHSPFPDMLSAATYVMESFARHAADGCHLLIKAHPFDTSMINWRRFINRQAGTLGIRGRVHFIDGGDLQQLAADASGMVCVNSTSATLALAAGTPVCALGDAIYNIRGLTFGRHLDEFWTTPERPEPGLYGAFRRVLVDRCLVRGGLASEFAVSTLVTSITDRLCGEAVPQMVESQVRTASK